MKARKSKTIDSLEELQEEEKVVEEECFDPNDPEQVFERYEKTYNSVVRGLEDSPGMNVTYLQTFTNLFDYYYNTHMRFVELTATKNVIKQRVKDTADRLLNIDKVSQQDASIISALEDEIETSHHLIDDAHLREQAAQEVIDNLRRTIGNLNVEIAFKNKMATSDLEENPKVAKHREGLERENFKLISEVSKLSEMFNNALEYQEDLERRTDLTDLKILELSDELEETMGEIEKYKQRKEKLESELEDKAEEIEEKSHEIVALNETLSVNRKIVLKYDAGVKEQTIAANKCFKELEFFNLKFGKILIDFDNLKYNAEVLKTEEIVIRKNEAVQKRELKVIWKNIDEQDQYRQATERQINALKHEGRQIIADRQKIREAIGEIEMTIMNQKQQCDMNRRMIQNIQREKDILLKNLLRLKAVSRDYLRLIKTQVGQRYKLESEIDMHILEGRKKVKQISYLEKERDRLTEEEVDKNKKIEDVMDDLRIYKSHIYELKKKLALDSNRLRMQQNLFDAVRADKTALQKSLSETTAKANDLQQKFHLNDRQNEHIKEEIANKQVEVLKGENAMKMMNSEMAAMKYQHELSVEQIKKLKHEIAEQKAEERILRTTILDGDKIVRAQHKTILGYMNERDVLATQFVHRNDELVLLYDKIKILQTAMNSGEKQYSERLYDIKLLKIEIKRLRQDKSLLSKSINSMNDLKQEVFLLEWDLNMERMKSKSLTEELHNTMNIHRWRKLEGSDPAVYLLQRKITLMQRRILSLTRQSTVRTLQLKETETMFKNLRHVLSRQPGPEIQQRLIKSKKALQNSTGRFKYLVNEFNALKTQNRVAKKSWQNAYTELGGVKQELIIERKKRQKNLAKLYKLKESGDLKDIKLPRISGGSTLGMAKSVRCLKF